ncbi:CRISPR-associated protein Cas7, partial [bacterium]
VKRSVIETIVDNTGTKPSSVTFVFDVNNKGALSEGEVLSACDPRYYDQLFGGWMFSEKGGGTKTLKRRSPFSISAMRPIHPLLCGYDKENITFDRSNRPELHKVIVRNSNGNKLEDDEIEKLLEGTDRSLYRKWIPENPRAYGLFVYDIAIDLRTLFCVSTNQFEPELRPGTIEELKKDGWIESKNVFGDCLVMPKEKREEVIPDIAEAMINWKISSNQARTFSLMETLAISISQNANTIPTSIRAKLIDDDSERQRAKLIIDVNAGADVFITPSCAAYTVVDDESQDAISDAEKKLIDILNLFEYDKQF